MAVEPTKTEAPPAKRRWRGWHLGLALLLVCAGFAFWFGSYMRGANVENGGLWVDPAVLVIGEVWENSRSSYKIPINNPSSRPLEVLDFARSCSCTFVKPRAFTVGPGETREIELELDLKALGPGQDAIKRPFQATFTPVVKGVAARHKGWTISGKVKTLLAVSPSHLMLRDDIVRGEPLIPNLVKVTAAIPLDQLAVDCDRNKAEVSVGGGPQDFQLEITPIAALPPGFFTFDVQLQPKRSGEQLPTKAIRVEGFMHQKLEAFPPKVVFGALPLGKAPTQSIVLASRNKKDFHVKSWKAVGGAPIVEEIARKEGQLDQAAFRITQPIVNLGKQVTTLTFLVQPEGFGSMQVSCDLLYYGLTATKD